MDFANERGHAQIAFPRTWNVDNFLLDPLHLEHNAVGQEMHYLISIAFEREVLELLVSEFFKITDLKNAGRKLEEALRDYNKATGENNEFVFKHRFIGPETVAIFQNYFKFIAVVEFSLVSLVVF